MLCSRCKKFDVQSFAHGSPLRGYAVKTVIDSAASGCTFCSLLLESVSARRMGNVVIADARQSSSLLKQIWRSVRPNAPMIYFYITQSKDLPDEEPKPLGMTHLNAVAGWSVWYLELSQNVVVFHTAADLGEFSPGAV